VKFGTKISNTDKICPLSMRFPLIVDRSCGQPEAPVLSQNELGVY